MKIRYVHDDEGARVKICTETASEARMLGALEPEGHTLKTSVTVETSGVYAGAPIKSMELTLWSEKVEDPPPIGAEPLSCWSVVIDTDSVLQSYRHERDAQQHANMVNGARVIRMREIL